MSKISEAIDLLYENFESISTSDQFDGKIKLIWKEISGKKIVRNQLTDICFGIWNRIYSINLSNKKEVAIAESNFLKLKKLTNDDWFYNHWNKTKYATLANLILDTEGTHFIKHSKYKLKVNDTKELETLISSWRSIGIQIEPQKIVKEVTSKIKKSNIEPNHDIIRKCSEILGPYSEYTNEFEDFYEHSKNLWVKKLSKPELKENIIKMSNKRRSLINGVIPRNHELAIHFKKYYNKECVVCGSKEKIEVSHKIPLHLGPEKYGFDLPFNMELCCHACHKSHEKNFDKKLGKSKDKDKFLKEIHDADVRNSEWTEYIDSKYYTVIPKPKIDYSGIVKCVKCLKRYNNIEKCKNCNHNTLPIKDEFWRIKL